MARLSRVLYKLFGADGPTDDFARFGSQVAGSPTKTKDITSIMSLPAWLTGLKAALNSGNRAPFAEDINSLMYVKGYMLAYLYQEGVPEWNADTEYHEHSVVKKGGTSELYASLINDNIGNALPSQVSDANWRYLDTSPTRPGTLRMTACAAAETGWLLCDGAAVSRSTYSGLFSAIGTAYGAGNGTTTFNLPDFRRRAPIGAGGTAVSGPANTLGAAGGAETHTLTTGEMPSHGHTVNDPGHGHGAQKGRIGAAGGANLANRIDGSADTAEQDTYHNVAQGTTGITLNNTGGGGAHNNMQPSLVVNFEIKI